MNESKKYEGYWWVPGQDDRVCGIAEYTPEDGISLYVFSNFSRSEVNEGDYGLREFDLIYGQTVNGKDITLKDSIEVGEESGKPEYRVSSLFLGAHVDEEPRFDEVRLEYPLLTEWAGISGLNASDSIQDYEEASAGDTIQIRHTTQEPLEVQVGTLNISFSQNVKSNRKWIGEASIEETTTLNIKQIDRQLTFNECLDKAKMFQDLLTLGTGESILTRRMAGLRSDNDTREKVEVMFYSQRRESYSPPVDTNRFKWNFVLDDINQNIETALTKWIDVYEELQPFFNSYTAIFNNNYTMDDEFILSSRTFYIYYLATRNSGSGSADLKWPESFDEILLEIVEENEQVFSNLNIDVRSSAEQLSERLNYYVGYQNHMNEEFDQQRSIDLLLYLRISLIAVLCSVVGIDDGRIIERLNRNYNQIE